MQTKISLGMVNAHIMALVCLVSTGLVFMMLLLLPGRRGGAALLHVLGLTPLLKGLLGHVLLDVLALLPRPGTWSLWQGWWCTSPRASGYRPHGDWRRPRKPAWEPGCRPCC